MVISSSHPPYAMAARPTPGVLYAVAFFVCMAIIAIAFMYFLRHGYFLIHVPTIDFKLPDLHLAGA
jgi:hypothetical protein